MKTSQSSLELITVIVFMLLLFTILSFLMGHKLGDTQAHENRLLLKEVADVVTSEIDLAMSVEEGYHRTFSLPSRLNGIDYNMTILYDPAVDHKELILYFVNYSEDYEYIEFLPKNLDGNIIKGENNIFKSGILVCLNKPTCP